MLVLPMTARFIIGDSLTVLKTLPDDSVDLVITSPPYLALRSYLPKDDPNKAQEMGSEGTPAAFIDALLDVTEELRRVLAPHGSLCIELGDTYAGSMIYQPEMAQGAIKIDRGQGAPWISHTGTGWPKPKSLALIPESFRWALAYGRNPFNGRETEPWIVRNVVRHFRPNPPVGALGDKVRPATSEWVVACPDPRRYFDLDAVREPIARTTAARHEYSNFDHRRKDKRNGGGSAHGMMEDNVASNPAGAPPLDWWADDDLEWRDAAGFIEPTAPFKGAHYATFSPKVVARLIKPQCPERVCRVCGEPSRRMTEAVRRAPADDRQRKVKAAEYRLNSHDQPPEIGWEFDRTTLGWSDCGHDDWRPGVVLDPFAGSGTTLSVATGHGRDAIGIDIDARNADLAVQRCGMWLTVEEGNQDITEDVLNSCRHGNAPHAWIRDGIDVDDIEMIRCTVCRSDGTDVEGIEMIRRAVWHQQPTVEAT